MPPLSQPDHPALTWLSILLPALVTGYAFGPLASVVLLFAETGETPSRINMVPVIVAGQVAVAILAAVFLYRTPGMWRRVGTGLQRAGWMLIATIPLLIAMAVFVARNDSSLDQGATTASFFMVILFGGSYGLQGAVLLGLGALAKRRASRA